MRTYSRPERRTHHCERKERVPAAPLREGGPQHDRPAPGAGREQVVHIAQHKRAQAEQLHGRLQEGQQRGPVAAGGPAPPEVVGAVDGAAEEGGDLRKRQPEQATQAGVDERQRGRADEEAAVARQLGRQQQPQRNHAHQLSRVDGGHAGLHVRIAQVLQAQDHHVGGTEVACTQLSS